MRFSSACFLSVFGCLHAIEFPPQLRGLLPFQVERFYRHLSKENLAIINDVLTVEHGNFNAQVRQLDAIDRQLAKQYYNALSSSFHKKTKSFNESLNFFYFWRVLHYVTDLVVFDATEANLNKFASDVVTEWGMLSVEDQRHFSSVFPEIVKRIKSHEFQKYASIGRKLWSFERFVVPST